METSTFSHDDAPPPTPAGPVERELSQALRESAEVLSRNLDLDQVLDRILESVSHVIPCEWANIVLVDNGIGRVVRSRGYEELGIKQDLDGYPFKVAEIPNFRRMYETGEPHVVVSTEDDSEWVLIPELEWIKSHASAPLVVRREVIGFLNLDSSTPGFFLPQHAEKLRAFASQAAVAIDNARLYEAERRRHAELVRSNNLIAALGRVAARMAETLCLDGVLETLALELHRIGLDVVVALREPDVETLALRYFSIDASTLSNVEQAIGQPLAGRKVWPRSLRRLEEVMSTAQPLFVPTLLELAAEAFQIPAPALEQMFKSIGIENDNCAVMLPLAVGDQTLGVVIMWGADLRESDVPSLAIFGNQVAAALKNATLFAQLQGSRQRVQGLSRQLLAAQESERQDLARELHDQIGQVLTGLKLSLEAQSRIVPENLKDVLAQDEKQVRELISQVREISLNLRPPHLDDLGLVPALQWHLRRYSSSTEISVDFKHDKVERRRFPPEIEITAFRIIQESLTNVARHARVSKAGVRLWATDETLNVQVSDRGVGMDAQTTLSSGATGGLAGMRERAALRGGKLAVDSAPGAGTSISAELPLSSHVERRSEPR